MIRTNIFSVLILADEKMIIPKLSGKIQRVFPVFLYFSFFFLKEYQGKINGSSQDSQYQNRRNRRGKQVGDHSFSLHRSGKEKWQHQAKWINNWEKALDCSSNILAKSRNSPIHVSGFIVHADHVPGLGFFQTFIVKLQRTFWKLLLRDAPDIQIAFPQPVQQSNQQRRY